MAAFIGGNLLVIAVGVMHQRIGLSARIGRVLIALGALGLCAMLAYFVDIGSGFNVLLGLVERAVVYPFLFGILWLGVTLRQRYASIVLDMR